MLQCETENERCLINQYIGNTYVEAYYPVSAFCFSTGKYDVYGFAAQNEQEQAEQTLEKPAEPVKLETIL